MTEVSPEDTAEAAGEPADSSYQSEDPISKVYLGSNLSDEQKNRLEMLLRDNVDVFETKENQGLTDTIYHRIDHMSSNPINCPPRRLPLGCVEDINKEIENLYRD